MPITFNTIKIAKPWGLFPPDHTESHFNRIRPNGIHETFTWKRDLPQEMFKNILHNGTEEELIIFKKWLTDEFSRCIMSMAYNHLNNDCKEYERSKFVEEALLKVYTISDIDVNEQEVLREIFNKFGS